MLHSGQKDLDAFRLLHGGRWGIDLVSRSDGMAFINQAIGVGKSFLMDDMIKIAATENIYELVIVLLPTRKLIDERPWIKNPPNGVKILNLRPRPSETCGRENDRLWSHFEKNGLGLLGKETICKDCVNSQGCFWHAQYSKKNLRSCQVIFATQTHLINRPDFINSIQVKVGAKEVLTLIDEGNLIVSPFRRKISRDDLEMFLKALVAIQARKNSPVLANWIAYVRALLGTTTLDLRLPGQWSIKSIKDKKLIFEIQEKGVDLYSHHFRYLGADIEALSSSIPDSRQKHKTGNVSFAISPSFGQAFAFFSGTTSTELARYRIGLDIKPAFENIVFEHPDTRWYNISSKIGMARYFLKNSPQIFDFFADLVVKRIEEGKSCVLLTKKKYLEICIKEMGLRINRNTTVPYKVIAGSDPEFNPQDPYHIPIIHYGMIGENTYEKYKGIYALNGFYVNEPVVNTVLQEILADDYQLPISISTQGMPLRRNAGVEKQKDRIYDTDQLAQVVLDDREMGVVLQAAGRVRPYTKPREVFLFQCAALPDREYHQEFSSLASARAFFGIPSRRNKAKKELKAAIHHNKQQGATQKKTASMLGISVRTVKRYWAEGDMNPL